jgi:anti-sigma factor RsiW
MFDCANVEMRELLPELAAGTLDAATQARVEQHVATCAECASELETLRLVKSAFASAPNVDVGRIVAALPKPASAPRSARGSAPVRRWMDWRVAAALTMITVGGLSLAVTQRLRNGTPNPPDSSVAQPPRDTTVVARAPSTPDTPVPRNPTGKGVPRSPTTVPAAPAKPQLAFARGAGDIDEASIKELLALLDEIDRSPVAPRAEPDPTPVLPVIKQSDR